MARLGVLRSLWRLLRWQKLLLLLGALATVEAAWRGAALWLSANVDPVELRERLAALPPGIKDDWAMIAPFTGYFEPTVALLVGTYAVGLLLWQLCWRRMIWPAALARWERPGHLLEILPPTDQALRWPAMESLLGQVFALLQADAGAVVKGTATTLSLEYWSGPAGAGLYCWLPASVDERLLGAFAEQLRAAYPGVRLRQADDPLRGRLLPLAEEPSELVLGVREYGLRAHADFPLRDPASFTADPLATLVGALQVEPSTPLVGLQIVLTAYNGAWRDDVARRIEALRMRELAVKRKAALPVTHAAEVRALGRQSDQFGFDTLVRAVVLGRDRNSGPAARARLDRITRQLGMYDAVTGSVRQGFAATASHQGALHEGEAKGRLPGWARRLFDWRALVTDDRGIRRPLNPLPAWARGALDRWPRPLRPLGRRLHVLGARELATLWHLPTKELVKLTGLNCWQRAQVFAAPNGVFIPGGEAAREWLITGVAPRELAAATAQQYVGLRRVALNQHIYVNGPTRSGKTKLLENMTRQDLEGGWGVGVIDPKGDYARKTILMVPWEREGQVCYFNPLDTGRRIMGVNPLERAAVERLGRDVVQSGAIGILGSLGAGWEQAPLGKRFMQHALALLLDAEPEPTFLHLYRLLQHSKEGNPYRDELLVRATPATAQNYSVVAADFWSNQVPGMKESQLGSLQTALTRTETFLANERVLQIVAQPTSTFSLRRIMDTKGIFVASVTAELGGDLQKFVGTLLMTMITQAGFSRNDIAEGQREFWRLTVDEFQKFIAMSGSAESFEDLLSMLGGMGVGLTMAHQAFKQLPPDLLGIILGNVGTRIFYPSQEDAAAIAARLGGQVRREDQLYLERFWTTQVLPMASGSSGPVTVAPLPMAPVAPTPSEVRAVSTLVLADPLVRRWGRATVAPDELASGALRDLVSAPAGEAEAGQRQRLAALAQALYGAERDDAVVKILCSLAPGDFRLYRAARLEADVRLRRQMLAYRRLCGNELNEETKLRRLATLSDLAYGTPVVEVRAQITRVMGQGLAGGADPVARFGGIDTTKDEASAVASADAGVSVPEVEQAKATASTFEEEMISTNFEGEKTCATSEEHSPANTEPQAQPVPTLPLPSIESAVAAAAGFTVDTEPVDGWHAADTWTLEAYDADSTTTNDMATVELPARRTTTPLDDTQLLVAQSEGLGGLANSLVEEHDLAAATRRSTEVYTVTMPSPAVVAAVEQPTAVTAATLTTERVTPVESSSLIDYYAASAPEVRQPAIHFEEDDLAALVPSVPSDGAADNQEFVPAEPVGAMVRFE